MKAWNFLRQSMSVKSALGLAGVCLVMGVLGGWNLPPWKNPIRSSEANPPGKEAQPETAPNQVEFPKSRWQAAGLRLESTSQGPFTESVWRTGKVKLNAYRVTHLSPISEGLVREILGKMGQEVEAGQILAYLESKEVGQAKLELSKSRLTLQSVLAQDEWTRTVAANTEVLLYALEREQPLEIIEKDFRGKILGEKRHQLLAAYSKRMLTRGEYQRQENLRAIGTTSQATLQIAKSEWETSEAIYQALLEETRFQNHQLLKSNEQRLLEARTQVALAQAQLQILGFSKAETEKGDALTEGARASYFPLRAPFAGTILTSDLALGERIGPQNPAFEVADLSTLWIQADVPEKDLGLAVGLVGQKTLFKTQDGQEKEAEVFFLGDRLDPDTRMVPLLAQFENRTRTLKPGMFVEVRLIRTDPQPVLQIPLSALVRIGLQHFVFVQIQEEAFERVEVELGKISANHVEITKGLQPGQTIVVEGTFALKSELLRSTLAPE